MLRAVAFWRFVFGKINSKETYLVIEGLFDLALPRVQLRNICSGDGDDVKVVEELFNEGVVEEEVVLLFLYKFPDELVCQNQALVKKRAIVLFNYFS
jgi:hypothetical protein